MEILIPMLIFIFIWASVIVWMISDVYEEVVKVQKELKAIKKKLKKKE